MLASNPEIVNQMLPTYIEAQVHGPINFAMDVAKMWLFKDELDQNDSVMMGNIQKFVDQHGIDCEVYDISAM